MKAAQDNPFHPQFGKRPDKFIGRDGIIHDFVNSLNDRNDPLRTLIIMGIRGSGKTALLSGVKQKIDRKSHIIVDVTAGTDLLRSILDQLQLSKDDKNIKITGGSVSALGFSVGFETAKDDQTHGFRYYLTQLVSDFNKKGLGVVFLIDEVHGDDEEMREFVTSYQHLVRDEADVALLMAGLPQSVNSVLNSKVLTFLRRAERVTLPNINLLLVRNMYANTFREGGFGFDEDTLKTAADSTFGFPYLIQLVGFWLWKTGNTALSSKDVENALVNSKAALFDNVYEIMFREISEKDREFLLGMQTDAGETQFGELIKRLDVTSGYASKYRQRLIQSGLIESTVHGRIAYAPPYFREFLELQKAVWNV
jgi:hypothetical protein